MGGGGSTYDYGFRIYNPTIGKFLSVDPLTGSYPMLTPYQFASNRPIDGVDLDGLEFYQSTLYDFKIESGLGLMTDRELLSIRIVPNSQNFRYYNNFLIRRSTSPSLLNGVSTAIDLGNEFSDLGLNTNFGFGKGLVILGKANSFLGIYSEFSNAYDIGFEKGMQEKQREFNFTKARDIKRAEWVREVIVEAFNSGVIVGDQYYLEKFANFALDGPPSGIEINAGLGLSVLDSNQAKRLNEDFAKLENFINSDENKFIEVPNTGIDKGSKPKFIKIYDKKFKAKPD